MILLKRLILIMEGSSAKNLEETFAVHHSAKLKRKCTDEKETYPHWKTFDCLIFQTLILTSITQSLFIVPKTKINQCSGKPVFDCQDSIHFSILERLYIILKSKLLKSYAEMYLFFGTNRK